MLCEEALVLSISKIHPKKLTLSFNQECPGCGFQLVDNLNCQEFRLPPNFTIQANPQCLDPEALTEPKETPGLFLPERARLKLDQDLSTGVGEFDERVQLRVGQLVVLQGEEANQLVSLIASRIISSKQGNDFVFLDGGNSFDTYTLFQHCRSQGLDHEMSRGKVHLSRAFTFHQLAFLVRDKLPNLLVQISARLVCVSDITLLFSDPDVRNKEGALQVFRESVRFLSGLAGRNNVLVIVTNLKSRDRKMESILFEHGHMFAEVERRGDSMELTFRKHPSLNSGVSIPIPLNVLN